MRVFTDGSCLNNGRADAKASYAVWFPEHPDWATSARVPATDAQTNNRGELRAILAASEILAQKGCMDENIVIYSDSDYCIKCITAWLPGWIARNWKTSDGKDVSNRDLIEQIAKNLSKFKSYRFHHVRAHTGGHDDLSKQNDVVDKMARAVLDDTVVVTPEVEDVLFEGCPLRLMGPPTRQSEVITWMREHLHELPQDVLNKHLIKAFAEMCKEKEVEITKQTIQKTSYLRAERKHLQIASATITNE